MLSLFTKPSYPKAAIGIEKDHVTALMVQSEGRGYGIRQASSVELAPGILEPGFLNRNLHDPYSFRTCLEEAITSAGLLGQKKWSVSLPANSARCSILTLENGAKGSTEEILDWKAEQAFGAPASELRVTRAKLANGPNGQERYFATAVKLSVIDEFETIFENLGWKAGLILPRALGEAKWLLNGGGYGDSMLISSQTDGFTAILVRNGEPHVVRSVTCSPSEADDEIYRLLIFYQDRFSAESGESILERILLVGEDIVPQRVQNISAEALGKSLSVLRPNDVGFNFPDSFRFSDLAAPGGLAAIG